MALAALHAADPVGVCFDYLRGPAAAEVAAILGGDAEVHVTGELEPGWPHVILATGPGGDLRDLLWDMEHEVMVEVYGSPAAIPGEAELWTVAVRIAQLLRDLPERDTEPGWPVVTMVRPSGTLAYQEMPSGHNQWTLGLLVTIHPAN